jgi:hypothetical protein
MAASAVTGEDGCDADGYRGLRGVPRVGAWRWLEDHELGVATELDADEAFEPVYILRRAFWVLMTLLVLCAVGIFFAMLYIARQQKALQQATLTAKKLGHYSLEGKLGSGHRVQGPPRHAAPPHGPCQAVGRRAKQPSTSGNHGLLLPIRK